MVSEASRPTGAAPASAATLWLAGLTAGLLTGLGEVVYHVWRAQTRTSDGLGAHVAWMAPLSNLLWFLPVAGLLVLLRRRISLPIAIGLLAGLQVSGRAEAWASRAGEPDGSVPVGRHLAGSHKNGGGVRRALLGWVKPDGVWARIFPPEAPA